jgi:hypothetical protein
VDIATKIQAVRERILRACDRAGRDAADVRLVGVSKGQPATAIEAAIRAGLGDLGENRVQEAAAKRPLIAGADRVCWHLVGHLQRNKVREALRLFDMIESVDSLRLAEELSRRASAPVPILLEVNVAGETAKSGFAPSEVAAAVALVSNLSHLDPRGLMTVAPAVADAEAVRPVFRELRRLAAAEGLGELSMGMTADFEVAVEEGATIVRIGRAIFGERP